MEKIEVRPEVKGFFLTHYYYVPFLLLASLAFLLAVIAGAVKTDLWLGIVVFVIVLLYSAATILHSKLHYDVTRIIADDEQVVYETGILHHRRKKIPVHMITDTAVDQPLYERILGVCTLAVSTAGTTGYDMEAHCIPYAQAKEFHTKLYQVIGKAKAESTREAEARQKVEEEVTDSGLMKTIFNYKPKIDSLPLSKKK